MQVKPAEASFNLTDRISGVGNISEALESIYWPQDKSPMEAAVNQLIEKVTWELVNLPRDCKPIPTRWVFNAKYDSVGGDDQSEASK